MSDPTAIETAEKYKKWLRLDAYYYGFTATGNEAVDNILGAVGAAGKGYHNTDEWQELVCDEGISYVGLIQVMADAAAEQIRAAEEAATLREREVNAKALCPECASGVALNKADCVHFVGDKTWACKAAAIWARGGG